MATSSTTRFTYPDPDAFQQAAVAVMAIEHLHRYPWARPAPAMVQRATDLARLVGADAVLRCYRIRPRSAPYPPVAPPTI